MIWKALLKHSNIKENWFHKKLTILNVICFYKIKITKLVEEKTELKKINSSIIMLKKRKRKRDKIKIKMVNKKVVQTIQINMKEVLKMYKHMKEVKRILIVSIEDRKKLIHLSLCSITKIIQEKIMKKYQILECLIFSNYKSNLILLWLDQFWSLVIVLYFL